MIPHTAVAAAALLSLTAGAAAPPERALSATPAADASPAAAPGPDHGKMVTDDATPAGAGALEVEAAYGPSLTHAGDGPFDRAAHAHSHWLTLTVLHGVTDHLDLEIGGGFGYVMDESEPTGPSRGAGAADLTLGSRWRFLAIPDQALDVMLTTTVIAPAGHQPDITSLGLSQGYWSVRNGLVASKDWDRTTANAELALTLPLGGGAAGLLWGGCGNVAVGYEVVSWLQPFAEVNYDVQHDGDAHQRLALTGGLNLSARSGARLLLGIQHAVWGRGVPQTTAGLVALKWAR
jgi:hypothetical protein